MTHKPAAAFGGGVLIGTLGGLIGLGGAEFRLPLLISVFRYAALDAVILNKAMSLLVVTSSLAFRSKTIPVTTLAGYWPVVLNLLAGSLIGAWLAAGWATRMKAAVLHRIMAVLLVLIAGVLLVAHDADSVRGLALTRPQLVVVGTLAGFGIGVVASLMGVAGGELLIPTLILLFRVDVKTAGSPSLAVSLPTMLIGFARYSRDASFQVLHRNRPFVATMAAGSVVGALLGGLTFGYVPSTVLLPLLAAILLASALKVWTTPASPSRARPAAVRKLPEHLPQPT